MSLLLRSLSSEFRGLNVGERKSHRCRCRHKTVIIAGYRHVFSLKTNELRRCEMESIESPYRHGKGIESPGQNRRNHFDESNTLKQTRNNLGMRLGQPTGMNPNPDLVLEEPAGDELLVPERGRWTALLFEQMCEGDRGVKVDQRPSRSRCRSCSTSWGIGSRGGIPAVDTAGCIHPFSTASASGDRGSTGTR